MRLTGFVFGIRVNKSFYIEDKLGAITDFILYTKGTEFGPSIFPRVQEQNGAKILFNEKSDNRFIVNHSDFIFDYSVKDNFDAELSKFLTSYSSIITKRLFKDFGIHNIMRFGFVIKAEIDDKDELTKGVHELIRKSYDDYDGDSLAIRFNIKVKKPLKIQNTVTEDFDNTIVTYDKPNPDSKMSFSVDYQKYFKPELGDINEAPQSFEDFCKACYKRYKESYCG